MFLYGVHGAAHRLDTPQKGSAFRGTFSFEAAPFDWGKEPETRPRYDTKDLIIYEMPLRSFTASPSSQLAEGLRGTYRGLKEKARDSLEHMGQRGYLCCGIGWLFLLWRRMAALWWD